MTTQAAEGLMRRRWTVAEIEEMVRAGILAEDECFELIGGQVVPKSASTNESSSKCRTSRQHCL